MSLVKRRKKENILASVIDKEQRTFTRNLVGRTAKIKESAKINVLSLVDEYFQYFHALPNSIEGR